MNTNFKTLARRHQANFRTDILNVAYNKYETWISETDGLKGLNFFNGFDIFKAVTTRYPDFNQGLYSDILRSQHIPFNFFVPFNCEKIFLKNVLNDFLNNSIISVDSIKIEYAPFPANKYLNDKTSFDVYIEYTHKSGAKGIVGIEVKYTEKAYPLKANSKEAIYIKNARSIYFSVTKECGIYKEDSIPLLITDKFRQVWRNQLLGEKILLVDKDKFKYFTSLTLFPKGNTHFMEASKEYIALLSRNNNNFLPVTYEEFFSSCEKYCPDIKFKEWIDYLKNRYII